MNDIVVTLTYSEEEAREVARAILYFNDNISATRDDRDRMTLIRSAIRRALPPPRPNEPQGLGAVVEDADGVRWVNVFEKGMWQDHRDRSQWREYREIAAVRVLSEGVTA